MYIEVKLYYGQNRLIKRVIMPNEIEEVVAYNSETGAVGCSDINNAALMKKYYRGLIIKHNPSQKPKNNLYPIGGGRGGLDGNGGARLVSMILKWHRSYSNPQYTSYWRDPKLG